MKKFSFVFVSVFLLAVKVQAAVVTEIGNYNVINGLEWLDLTETDGMSINSALATYSADGWRVANKSEFQSMYAVFDTFADTTFGPFVADSVYNNTGYDLFYKRGASDFRSFSFFDVFGRTENALNASRGFVQVSAIGFYLDSGVVYYGGAGVRDYISLLAGTSDYAQSYYDYVASYSQERYFDSFGVFLVRGQASENTAIPLPMPLVMIGLGLLVMRFWMRASRWNVISKNVIATD